MEIKQQLTIAEDQSIREALRKIDANKEGCVFVVSLGMMKVVGIATDGDIRRFLMKEDNLDHPISNCMNTSFISAHNKTPREQILKLLDHKIKVIPILKEDGTLDSIVSRRSYPLYKKERSVVISKSPARVSFGGGGSDLTNYFFTAGGVVLNATIKKYCTSILTKRKDSKVNVWSADLNEGFSLDSLDQIHTTDKLPLITSVLKLIKPSFGFDLTIQSDFPVGSGLGGSAVVLSSIIGCFNRFNEDAWDSYEIAEMAFQAERLFLDISGGWQDQYATVFGGFNFMEFNNESNIVHPLRLLNEVILQLEESLILVFTGKLHNSGQIQNHTKKVIDDGLKNKALLESKKITYQMKTALLKGNVGLLGPLLHQAWNLKKEISTKASTPQLNEVYDFAINNGAMGGKILGAGQGGFFLFFVPPQDKHKLALRIKTELKLEVENIGFDQLGLRTSKIKKGI